MRGIPTNKHSGSPVGRDPGHPLLQVEHASPPPPEMWRTRELFTGKQQVEGACCPQSKPRSVTESGCGTSGGAATDTDHEASSSWQTRASPADICEHMFDIGLRWRASHWRAHYLNRSGTQTGFRRTTSMPSSPCSA